MSFRTEVLRAVRQVQDLSRDVSEVLGTPIAPGAALDSHGNLVPDLSGGQSATTIEAARAVGRTDAYIPLSRGGLFERDNAGMTVTADGRYVRPEPRMPGLAAGAPAYAVDLNNDGRTDFYLVLLGMDQQQRVRAGTVDGDNATAQPARARVSPFNRAAPTQLA